MSRAANIKRLFNPKSMVFVGGSAIAEPLRTARSIGFKGDIWVVNPKVDEIAGVKAYKSVKDLPGVPDAAFIAVNRELAVEVVRELNQAGTAGIVMFTAGFAEVGGEGVKLHHALLEAAGDMAVMGPNCYGYLNYVDDVGMWADFHGGYHVEKGVAIISQSGNVGLNLNMADRALPVSFVISAGNQAVLGISDYIEALIQDDRVTAVGFYIEGLDDVEKFTRAAVHALEKGVPLVALKGGTSQLGTEMTMSHTSSLAGSDEMYSAMFARLGIVRVRTLSDLMETLKFFSISGQPKGRRLGVLTCSGGDSAMMADTCEPLNIELPKLNDAQINEMKTFMPEDVALINPLDYNAYVWGHPELMVQCFSTMMKTDNYDAVTVVLDYPKAGCSEYTQWDNVANSFIEAFKQVGKPAAVISNFAELLPPCARARMVENGVTPLQGLTEGTRTLFNAGWYGEQRAKILGRGNLENLIIKNPADAPTDAVLINEWDSKHMLGVYGLPIPRSELVPAVETGKAAAKVGFPVVTKIVSDAIAHKTEAGAVKLNLKTVEEVDAATRDIQKNIADFKGVEDTYLVEQMVSGAVAELIIGLKRDEQFGLALIIGSGGILVNLINDSAALLLPTNAEAVLEALQSLKGFKLLKGYRGKEEADVDAVVRAVLSVAQFAQDHADDVTELDVNPLMVLPKGKGVIAADALIRMRRK